MERPLRSLLVTSGFSASETDWCIPALLDHVRALSRHVELVVLPLRYPPTRFRYAVGDATVEPLGGGACRGLRRAPLLLRAWLRILALHRRRPVDLVHALVAHEPGFVAAVAARLINRPLVVSMLGGELVAIPEIGYGGLLSAANRYMTRFALSRAECVTVASKWHLGATSAADSRWSVLPFGVPRERFAPTGEAARLEGDPALLHVGSLVPVKGHETLFAALAEVRVQLPGTRLHIVGDGPLRQTLDKLATRLGVADLVRFRGAVEHDRMPDFYRGAGMLVVSSLFENQAMAALEAAACGCSVVGTEVGAVPEIASVAPVPPGDAAQLAAAIQTAWVDPDRRRKATSVTALVVARWSVEAIVEQWLSLYRGLGSAAFRAARGAAPP